MMNRRGFLASILAAATGGPTGRVNLALADAQVAAIGEQPDAVPTLSSIPLDVAVIVCDRTQYDTSRYERYQNPLVFTTTAISLQFQKTNLGAGGSTNVTFAYPQYAMLVNGVQRAVCTPDAGTRRATLTGAFVDEPDGMIEIRIIPLDANGAIVTSPTEGFIPHLAYLDRVGEAKNETRVALQLGSKDWELQRADGTATGTVVTHQWAVIDKAVQATRRIKPLVPRLGVPFDTALPNTKLTRINYVVPSDGTPRTPCMTKSGITVSENRQPYFYADLFAKTPRLPILDGPRGFCTTHLVTDVKFGRNGKIYGADPWSRWVVDAAGTRRTLFGMRHKYAPVWKEATLWGPEAECVGNWDASIPSAERYPWESWGMAWDQRTLAIDRTAPIPPGETEEPHFVGPTMFCTDRHGYILKAVFSPVSHATPAVVTRHAPGNDPWGMDADGTTLYVAERGAHRISKYDMDTGAYLGALIEDTTAASLGSISVQGRRWSGADQATCRTHPIVAPEGVVVWNGYCYWGSFAQGEVRRIPLTGGTPEVVCRPWTDNNSNYIYISISDGSFGPAGTVFTSTWSGGFAAAFLPVAGLDKDGTPCTNTSFQMVGGVNTNVAIWRWAKYGQNIPEGPGGFWQTGFYVTATAVGRKGSGTSDDPDYGALVTTSSEGSLSVFVQSDATDGAAPDQARMRRGYLWYAQNAYLVHGPYCNGPDVPLPWGQNADADYFMQQCGYAPN